MFRNHVSNPGTNNPLENKLLNASLPHRWENRKSIESNENKISKIPPQKIENFENQKISKINPGTNNPLENKLLNNF